MSQNRLEQVIRKKIDRAGPITFESFMDLSLYHPEFGYYANKRINIESRRGFKLKNRMERL